MVWICSIWEHLDIWKQPLVDLTKACFNALKQNLTCSLYSSNQSQSPEDRDNSTQDRSLSGEWHWAEGVGPARLSVVPQVDLLVEEQIRFRRLQAGHHSICSVTGVSSAASRPVPAKTTQVERGGETEESGEEFCHWLIARRGRRKWRGEETEEKYPHLW